MAKNNNNNNMLKKRKVTKKEIDEFDLTTHLVNFLWNEPFYSRILRSLNKEETETIPTAGVTCVDGDITLYWNREFLDQLTKFPSAKHDDMVDCLVMAINREIWSNKGSVVYFS